MIKEMTPLSFLPCINKIEVEALISDNEQCCDFRIFTKMPVIIKKESMLSKNTVMKKFITSIG